MSKTTLEDIVSLAKRRGFIYQGSEVYGGLSGTWDYGPLGVALKRNIQNLWWKMFVEERDDMFGVDTAILMNQKVWQASGHVDTFTDPLVEDIKTHRRYRADHLLKDSGVDPTGMTLEQITAAIKERSVKSPDGNELSSARTFNMMFKTFVGPMQGDTIKIDELMNDHRPDRKNLEGIEAIMYDPNSVSYLRPETAQGMFVNFKNIVDSYSPNIPFGIAQMGRAFRNEISPRDFIFRAREFEIMELEYFLHPDGWEKHFEVWRKLAHTWFEALGLPEDKIKEVDVPAEDRAHYSKRTVDFYYDFPSLGFDEIAGLAYRTDFDLSRHQEHSGRSMEYRPKDGGQPFVPHVIEPTFGFDRNLMAVLSAAYTEDEVNGEKRVYLKLPEHLAPVKYAVSPLLKNKPELVKKAREVYIALKKKHGAVTWDDNGNIGKRYRRQDEIGTPYCVVIDFQTIEDGTITVRDRDTTEQKRVKTAELIN